MNVKNDPQAEEMLGEYDFSGGVRGLYAKRFPQETRLVQLDPDVAAAFPDAESVNAALRRLIQEGLAASKH